MDLFIQKNTGIGGGLRPNESGFRQVVYQTTPVGKTATLSNSNPTNAVVIGIPPRPATVSNVSIAPQEIVGTHLINPPLNKTAHGFPPQFNPTRGLQPERTNQPNSNNSSLANNASPLDSSRTSNYINLLPGPSFNTLLHFRKQGIISNAQDLLSISSEDVTWIKVNYNLEDKTLITGIKDQAGNVRLRYTNVNDNIDLLDITLVPQNPNHLVYTAPNGKHFTIAAGSSLPSLCLAVWHYMFIYETFAAKLAQSLNRQVGKGNGFSGHASPLIGPGIPPNPMSNPIIPIDPGLIIDPSTGKPLPRRIPDWWGAPNLCPDSNLKLVRLPYDPTLDYTKSPCIPHDLKCSFGTDDYNNVNFWFPFCGAFTVNVGECCKTHDISLWCATGSGDIFDINWAVNKCIQDKVFNGIKSNAHGLLCNLFAFSYEIVSFFVTSLLIVGGLEAIVLGMRPEFFDYDLSHKDSCLCGGKLPTTVCNGNPNLACCDICSSYGKQESCFDCYWTCDPPNPFGGSNSSGGGLLFVTGQDGNTIYTGSNPQLPCCPGTDKDCNTKKPQCP